jgi:hypothetical protein
MPILLAYRATGESKLTREESGEWLIKRQMWNLK